MFAMHALSDGRPKPPVLTKLMIAMANLAIWRAQLSFSTRFAHTDSTLFERLSDTTGTIRSLRGTSPLGRGGAVGAIPFATVEGSYVGAQIVQALSRSRRLNGVQPIGLWTGVSPVRRTPGIQSGLAILCACRCRLAHGAAEPKTSQHRLVRYLRPNLHVADRKSVV